MVFVSEQVRREVERVGAAGWLRDLAAMVADLQREWGITVGRQYPDSTEAFVAEAVTRAGEPVVLKALVPGRVSTARHEITVLRLAGGDGCVRLLRHDAERGVLLLERLGRPLVELALPMARRHEILTATAARIWRRAPDSGLPTGAHRGRLLAEYVARTWQELDRPCSERAVEQALACAGRRVGAHDDERAVLVHGDVHQWNTLQVADGSPDYKLVDPDGLLTEPEYDLGVIMREDPEDLMHGDPHERSRWLATRTGLDETAVWEWGVVERVAGGLLCTATELQPVGRQMLAAADRCAGW